VLLVGSRRAAQSIARVADNRRILLETLARLEMVEGESLAFRDAIKMDAKRRDLTQSRPPVH
jgi:hypothetical protein